MQTVSVIIASRNAEATIAKAVRSALHEPETVQVIVVDDASTDNTSGAARSADDGTGRLNIVTLEKNAGPSGARNLALDMATGDTVAILDSDDFFLPGRFTAMFAHEDWDLIADDIYFTTDAAQVAPGSAGSSRAKELTLASFVEGNLPQGKMERGELGFLKPVMNREFLVRHGLRYLENLRLGEDYALYTQMLLRGARFKVISNCGYTALVRADSLSGRHRTNDLKNLYDYDLALYADKNLTPRERVVIGRHVKLLKGKFAHRHFLDLYRQSGMAKALSALTRDPEALLMAAGGVLRDKWSARFARQEAVPAGGRYLLQNWF